MAALSDLLIEEPVPSQAQLPVRCRNCMHFSTIPYYRVDGRPTVCSDTKIGRREKDMPCPHFAVDMTIMRRLKPEVVAGIGQILTSLSLDLTADKKPGAQRADLEALVQLNLIFRAVLNARRAGLELGGVYNGATPTGSPIKGTLLSLSREHAVLTAESGVSYTVTRSSLVQA